jgi:hypothetical protein
MSDAVGSWSLPSPRPRPASVLARSALDPRRALQLALGGLWLLDGILQFQPYMFTRDFARQMLAPSAAGNPGVVAGPITWVAHLTAQHSVGANTAFALTQLLLGLGIAWRPTLKPALAASIVWALAVWWLGEGLGGVLTGGAGPVAGGPGAAFLYAVLAVLLWPPGPSSSEPAPFVAAGRLGATRGRLVWFVLWVALAGFAVQGANRSAQGLHDIFAGSASGQPAWLAAIANRTAGLVADRGLTVSIALAVVLAALAVGIFGPPLVVRTAVVVAVVLAAAIWLTAQALGGLVGGQGTDPNSGPLLILLALAYWPLARPPAPNSAFPPSADLL